MSDLPFSSTETRLNCNVQDSNDPLPFFPSYKFRLPPPPQTLVPSSLSVQPGAQCDDSCDQLTAIDIALIPPLSLMHKIINDTNKPLQEYGSWPLDTTSHFPHISLLHTIVRYCDLDQICQDILSLVHPSYIDTSTNTHTNEKRAGGTSPIIQMLANWHKTVLSGTNQYYSYVKSSQHTSTLPEHPISASFCPSLHTQPFSFPLDVEQSHLSHISLLYHEYELLSTHLSLNIIFPGPYPQGRDSAPFVGFENPHLFALSRHHHHRNCPLLEATYIVQQPNGLIVRLLHDMLCARLLSYRRVLNLDSLPDNSPSVEDGSCVKHDDNHVPQVVQSQFDLAQHVFYTGSGAVTLESTTVADNDNASSPSHQINVQTQHTDCTNDNSHISSHYNIEPGEISTLRYTNGFNNHSHGELYNPHITIGNTFDNIIAHRVLQHLCVKQDEIVNPKSSSSIPSASLVEPIVSATVDNSQPIVYSHAPPYRQCMPLQQPYESELSQWYLCVMQLGRHGTCRYPIFKIPLCDVLLTSDDITQQ